MTFTIADEFSVPQDKVGHIRPLSELAEFIAGRIKPHGEPIRVTIDKVRKRMLYAAKIGALHPIPGSFNFFAPEVEAWAKSKWPSEFQDVARVLTQSIEEKFGISDRLESRLIPNDLGRCKEELELAFSTIQQLRDRSALLEDKLREAQEEVARLTPLAQGYENIRRKNRLAAKRPRKSIW